MIFGMYTTLIRAIYNGIFHVKDHGSFSMVAEGATSNGTGIAGGCSCANVQGNYFSRVLSFQGK